MGCPYTREQAIDAIVGWSRKYGYSESFLQAALAIAIGESSLNPCARGDYNEVDGKYHSFGIYQFLDEWNGNRGRGWGMTEEQRQNPYILAEINLPILHDTFEKYGGDSAWQNDPYGTLKSTWKYGQGSIWPSDGQLRGALGSLGSIDVANFDSSWPEPSAPQTDTQPQPDMTPPATDQNPSAWPDWITPTWERSIIWPKWLEQNAFSGLERQPVGGFMPGVERQPIALPATLEMGTTPPPSTGWELLRQVLDLPPLTNRTFPPSP